ncbi:hypothetical protein O9993_21460 [Vibrio lentus]|nr:hypothetical protein [Vibrio lentus]
MIGIVFIDFGFNTDVSGLSFTVIISMPTVVVVPLHRLHQRQQTSSEMSPSKFLLGGRCRCHYRYQRTNRRHQRKLHSIEQHHPYI